MISSSGIVIVWECVLTTNCDSSLYVRRNYSNVSLPEFNHAHISDISVSTTISRVRKKASWVISFSGIVIVWWVCANSVWDFLSHLLSIYKPFLISESSVPLRLYLDRKKILWVWECLLTTNCDESLYVRRNYSKVSLRKFNNAHISNMMIY